MMDEAFEISRDGDVLECLPVPLLRRVYTRNEVHRTEDPESSDDVSVVSDWIGGRIDIDDDEWIVCHIIDL